MVFPQRDSALINKKGLRSLKNRGDAVFGCVTPHSHSNIRSLSI